MFDKKRRSTIVKKLTAAICACGFLASIGLATAYHSSSNTSTINPSNLNLNSSTSTASPVEPTATTDPSTPATPPPTDKQTYINVAEINANMNSIIDKNQYIYNVTQDDIRRIIYNYVVRPVDGFVYRDINFDSTKDSKGFKVNGTEGTIDT